MRAGLTQSVGTMRMGVCRRRIFGRRLSPEQDTEFALARTKQTAPARLPFRMPLRTSRAKEVTESPVVKIHLHHEWSVGKAVEIRRAGRVLSLRTHPWDAAARGL